jgi:hypothetical protein
MPAEAYSSHLPNRSAGVGSISLHREFRWGQNANLSKSFMRLAGASDLFIGKKSSRL